MYNIHFYVCFLLLAFFVAFPCLLVISVITWLNSLETKPQITLDSISNEIKTISSAKDLEGLYNKFLMHFKKIPESSFQDWIQCVSDLVITDLASLDMIIGLKEKLENENPLKRKEIANTIALVLKNKKR